MSGGGVGGTYHLHHLGVYIFGDNITLCCDVVQHLVQRLGFDLLPLQFGVGVVEIEEDSALVEFLDEELWTFRKCGLCACRGQLSAITRNKVYTRRTHKGGQLLNLNLFSYHETAAPLFARWFYRNRVLRS